MGLNPNLATISCTNLLNATHCTLSRLGVDGKPCSGEQLLQCWRTNPTLRARLDECGGKIAKSVAGFSLEFSRPLSVESGWRSAYSVDHAQNMAWHCAANKFKSLHERTRYVL